MPAEGGGGAGGRLMIITTAISLPCDFRNAFVHRVLRGFLFFLKFLWHFERQNLKI